MAVTIAHVKSNSVGSAYEHLVDVTGPASYTTGGEAIPAAQVGQLLPRLGAVVAATDISKVNYFQSEVSAAGVKVTLDRVNGKFLFFAAGAESGAGSNQSAVPVRCLVRYGMSGD